MSNNEWYRGTSWDIESQELFENKLKKSRDSYNKAQYLRIKASYLLDSQDSLKETSGIKLMNRLFTEYPAEISHGMFGYEQLGDYYFMKGKYIESEFNYRQSVSFYRDNGRSGTSGIGDIKLAEVILKTKQSEKFAEMYSLLTKEFKKNQGSLSLNDDIFRYYSALAKLADKLVKTDEAKQYAQKALELSSFKKPQLDKYPELGIINPTIEDINTLKEILKSSKGNISD